MLRAGTPGYPALIRGVGIGSLQRAIGNRAVVELLGKAISVQRDDAAGGAPVDTATARRQARDAARAAAKAAREAAKAKSAEERAAKRAAAKAAREAAKKKREEEKAAKEARARAFRDSIAQEMAGATGGPYADFEAFKQTLKSTTFLGHSVENGVRQEFQDKLKDAEVKIGEEFTKSGNPIPDKYGIDGIGGFREEVSQHGWGLAVDLDAGKNPYVMHQAGGATVDAELGPVYENIAEFVLNAPVDGHQSIIPVLITQGKNLPASSRATRAERLGQYWDRLKLESEAMKTYFRLMKDEAALTAHLAGPWTQLHPTKPVPTVEVVVRQMWKDYAVLGGAIPKGGPPGVQGFTEPVERNRPFHPTNRAQKDPGQGFLTIPREVVIGLGRSVRRWGAIDFGAESGDVMHFDDRTGLGVPFDAAKDAAIAKATAAAEKKKADEAAAKQRTDAAAASGAAGGTPTSTTPPPPAQLQRQILHVQRQPTGTPPFADAVPPPLIMEPQPQPKPFERGSGPYVRRPGEAWAYGPASSRKSANRDLQTFVAWIREVEQVYGPNQADVYQRLRRLYYSSYSGAAGAKFDALIREREGAEGPPMTVKKVRPATLDGLYAIDNVVTPTGKLIDPAHIFAAADVATAGITTRGFGAEVKYGTPILGVVTWTGDLVSWWIEWIDRVKKLGAPMTRPPSDREGRIDTTYRQTGPIGDEALWVSVGASKASKEDLLGDMDAQIIATRSRKEAIQAVKRGDDAPEGEGILDVVASSARPMSEYLDSYYGLSVPGGTATGESNRFASFVENAQPAISHRKVKGATGPNGRVELGPNAQFQMDLDLLTTAKLFFYKGTKHPDEVFDAFAYRIWDIGKRFVKFLETGLKNGDAPWP